MCMLCGEVSSIEYSIDKRLERHRGGGGTPHAARRRGAWPVDGKESYALVAQVVAHHQAAEG